MPIRRLPETVANRIRAGEVVDRPAQVAKELVENALDGGATDIRVSVRGGGAALIAVEDNGAGIPADELSLAVERHTTSKLDNDNLASVITMGFRGEALAAIGAVSRLTLSSRTIGTEHGWAVDVSNGAVAPLRPCSCPRGTRAEVRDLFSAHPARAAFLRSSRQEMAMIRAAIEGHALARPDVGFSLENEGRRLLHCRPSDAPARIRDVLGAAFADNSVPFSAEIDGLRVSGWTALPTWAGHASTGQRLFVNRRPVRDDVLTSALRAAYSDLLRGVAPAAVVMVETDPAAVDPNASPTKAEVRFRDGPAVHALLREALSAALASAGPLAAPALSLAAAAAARPTTATDFDDRRLRPLGRALGTAFGRYVLAEAADGVVVIDLHAAHERVVHERLKAQPDGAAIQLPTPLSVLVGARAAAAVDAAIPGLSARGLSLRPDGDDSLCVLSVPAALGPVDPAALTRDIAAALAADPLSDPLGERLAGACALAACHAALRSGDTIATTALDAVLREIEDTPNAAQCNHGRPTSIRIAASDLDRLFARL